MVYLFEYTLCPHILIYFFEIYLTIGEIYRKVYIGELKNYSEIGVNRTSPGKSACAFVESSTICRQ